MKGFSLKDDKHFPTFATLPNDRYPDRRYYNDKKKGAGPSAPTMHWCLLAEIVETIPYSRPMFTIRDKDGRKILVAFYLDNNQRIPPDVLKHATPGYTMAIMYAEQHEFMDGQIGIRLEDVGWVKTFPCTLNTFLGVGDRLESVLDDKNCQTCSGEAASTCISCTTVRYCNKECQKADWAQRHKRECSALKQVKDWKDWNWKKFQAYWRWTPRA